jgi:hypothetical protein
VPFVASELSCALAPEVTFSPTRRLPRAEVAQKMTPRVAKHSRVGACPIFRRSSASRAAAPKSRQTLLSRTLFSRSASLRCPRHGVTTILPNIWLFSRYSCAARISLSGKTRSTTGLSRPAKT